MQERFRINSKSLENEVKMASVNTPESRISALVVHVSTGAGGRGIYHHLEHAVFKGVGKKTETEIYNEIANHGAIQGAYTGKEQTTYYIVGLNETMKDLIPIQVNTLLKPSFPPGPVNKEKKAIIDEKNGYADIEPSVALEEFERLIFEKSPMAETILGTKREIQGRTLQELIDVKNKKYVGRKMAVALVGDVSQLNDITKRFFVRFPKGEHEKPKEILFGKKKFSLIESDSQNDYFFIGYPGLPMNDKDFYTLQLIEVILGGHSVFEEEHTVSSSRLYDIFRVSNSLAYDISATSFSGSSVGYFAVRGNLSRSNIENGIKMIRRQTENLAKTVTKEEVERAKRFLQLYYVLKAENTLELALHLGLPTLFYGKASHPITDVDKILNIRLGDVRRVAQRIFKPEEERLVILGRKTRTSNTIRRIVNHK